MAIITSIEYINRYLPHSTDNICIINYLKNALTENTTDNKRIRNLSSGAFEKYFITDDIYALEQVFYTKPRTECFFESHRKYVDIQMIISGSELIECISTSKLNIKVPYNSDKDLITYQDTINSIKLPLSSNEIAIYFQEDAHMCMNKIKDIEKVIKTVVKVPKGRLYLKRIDL